MTEENETIQDVQDPKTQQQASPIEELHPVKTGLNRSISFSWSLLAAIGATLAAFVILTPARTSGSTRSLRLKIDERKTQIKQVIQSDHSVTIDKPLGTTRDSTEK